MTGKEKAIRSIQATIRQIDKLKAMKAKVDADIDLLDEAFEAYHKKFGENAMQPSRISSKIGRRYVQIRNGNLDSNLLARYDRVNKKLVD